MANLQVKDIDDRLYEALRYLAVQEHRSISQQIILILEWYLQTNRNDKNNTMEFLKLSGSWTDDREADDIITDLYKSRKNKAEADDGLFD